MKTPQLQVNLTESPTLGDTFTINDIMLTYKNAKNNIEVIC